MLALLRTFLLAEATMFAFASVGSTAGWCLAVVAGALAVSLRDSTYTKAAS